MIPGAIRRWLIDVVHEALSNSAEGRLPCAPEMTQSCPRMDCELVERHAADGDFDLAYRNPVVVWDRDGARRLEDENIYRSRFICRGCGRKWTVEKIGADGEMKVIGECVAPRRDNVFPIDGSMR